MNRLVDLHVHPSLKMYYLPYLKSSFHSSIPSGNFWNPLSFRTRYKNLKDSPEKIMVCAHYVIERGFVAKGIKWFGRAFAWSAAPWFYGKLRLADEWVTLCKQIRTLDKAAKTSNKKLGHGDTRLKVVRDFNELQNLKSNEIALIHAVEGAHSLGYGPKKGQTLEQFWDQTAKRLEYLKEKGVCMVTLTHFWDNMFCPQTNGTEYISKKIKGNVVSRKDDAMFFMSRAKWQWGDKTKLAESFTKKLLELGIIVDVSHCQEHARWNIYDLCAKYNRPVTASHVGLQHFFNHEYNISDAEVKEIHKLGGVVGLILSRRWLVDPIRRHKSDGKGINDLIQNMLHIRDLTGDVSAIGIGTDFDGLTHPFKDVYVPNQLGNITKAMTAHFDDGEIDRILYGNGLRLLEKGWD